MTTRRPIAISPAASAQAPLRPILVLALDGATFDVIRPMVEAGELPNLARWMREGSSAELPSTTPPVTFPAWSSFMTGVPPAEHGIFDFTQKRPGEYRLRFVNATDRAAKSIFRRVCDAGGRVLVLGLPATHPPEPLDGLLVCGFDAPVSAGTDERSASDPALYRSIAERAGPWMRPELDESARASDFHERAVGTLLSRIERKVDFAREAIAQLARTGEGARPALTMVVFSESDTAGHHYWRDHDPRSPRHDPQASAERRDALRAVYRRLDAACGELRDALGAAVPCVVLSDHGMGGASDEIVHLNRFLAERGLLARRAGIGRFADRAARRLRDVALAVLPASLAQQLFRRARAAAAELESRARFGGFDWQRTLAFSEEANTNPGVWINLAGREAQGSVAPADYEATRDRVIAALLDWKGPSGEPVVARALRREQVHRGPFADRAPDVVVELALDRGYGRSLVPTPWAEGGANGEGIPSVRVLAAQDHEGGRGRGMNGTHRSRGIWIASAGAGADMGAPLEAPPASLVEVAPWLARAMGLAWDAPTDASASQAVAPPGVDYDEEEEAMVAERLRALGYLE
ncbi:MAG: alkaline phosphatase family protein [Spirochaetaceae bacterium]|nr:alkaline phosphatase family protein [Myxococcales bacterium]MCB9723917.1 alkaline phosphatase family protein [Spirochaetaceae bacterium]